MQNEQLQQRVTDLEKAQQQGDSQIVDLQYQVKDLSGKIDSLKTQNPTEVSQGLPETAPSAPAVIAQESKEQIVRVDVSVDKIQRALKSAGVYTGPVDGKIGPGTKEAIIEFQKSHGLKADGVLGRMTWKALKKYLR